VLLGAPGGLTGDVEVAWRTLTNPAHGLIHIVTAPEDLARHKSALEADLIVDAVLGTGFKQGDFVAVDRNGSAADAQKSVEAAGRVLAKGVHFTAFAEGTRSRDGRMLPFKKGPFFLAMATGAPVVPVSIHGTEGFLRKGSLRICPGTAEIVFHPAIDPASFATREELMATVRTAIASGLPEWMRT